MAGTAIALGTGCKKVAEKNDVKIIFPVDTPTLRAGYSLMEEVYESISLPKIGLELINNVTLPTALQVATDFGKKAFADVKLVDIPNTIYGAAKGITKQVLNGMEYFNVMAFGMEEMMAKAVKGRDEQARILGIKPPKIIAVHYLTSMNITMLRQAGISPPPGMIFDSEGQQMSWFTLKLAEMSVNAGMDILLTSAREAPSLHKKFPEKEIWSPGIRLPWDPPDDQKRTMTPGEAYRNGVRGFIIGRPIREPKGGKTRHEVITAIYADIASAR